MKMNETKTNWALLGGLRFFLAFVVLSQHMQSFAPNKIAGFFAQFDARACVIAFLMISGYSIRHSIETRPIGYLMRRIQRVYPIYIVCLLFAVWVYFQLIQKGTEWPGFEKPQVPDGWTFLSSVFLVQSILGSGLVTLAPAWSLSVEAVFYVAAPYLIKLSQRAILFVIAASSLFYFYASSTRHGDLTVLLPFSLAWAWLLGWVALKNETALWTRYALLALPAILVHSNSVMSNTLAIVPGIVTALAISHSHELSFSANQARVASYLGELSYPLYLVHYPILYLILCYPRAFPLWGAYPLCLAASALLYHAVDLPIRQRAARLRQNVETCGTQGGALVAERPAQAR